MKLAPLTREYCELVRQWRNEALETLRTPYPSTKEMQDKFYDEVICNPQSPHKYWAVGLEDSDRRDENSNITISAPYGSFLAMGGITNIQWENRLGEISLIVNPRLRHKGLGENVVDLLLDQAFNYLNLQTVYGECYYCNEAYNFWGNLLGKYPGYRTDLPNRKYYLGKYYGSVYFSIDKDDFNKCKSGDTQSVMAATSSQS